MITFQHFTSTSTHLASIITGEACVVDMFDKKQALLTPVDLLEWEKLHGEIHSRCVMLLRTQQVNTEFVVTAGLDSKNVTDDELDVLPHWPGLIIHINSNNCNRILARSD